MARSVVRVYVACVYTFSVMPSLTWNEHVCCWFAYVCVCVVATAATVSCDNGATQHIQGCIASSSCLDKFLDPNRVRLRHNERQRQANMCFFRTFWIRFHSVCICCFLLCVCGFSFGYALRRSLRWHRCSCRCRSSVIGGYHLFVCVFVCAWIWWCIGWEGEMCLHQTRAITRNPRIIHVCPCSVIQTADFTSLKNDKNDNDNKVGHEVPPVAYYCVALGWALLWYKMCVLITDVHDIICNFRFLIHYSFLLSGLWILMSVEHKLYHGKPSHNAWTSNEQCNIPFARKSIFFRDTFRATRSIRDHRTTYSL